MEWRNGVRRHGQRQCIPGVGRETSIPTAGPCPVVVLHVGLEVGDFVAAWNPDTESNRHAGENRHVAHRHGR